MISWVFIAILVAIMQPWWPKRTTRDCSHTWEERQTVYEP